MKSTSKEMTSAPGKEVLPSYAKCDHSPEIEGGGVGINVVFADALRKARLAFDDPCPTYGFYTVDVEDVGKLGKLVHGRVTLTVTNQETGEAFVWPLVPLSSPLGRSRPGKPPGKDLLYMGGYFNLDLKERCCAPGEFGRFWVIFQLGRHVSPVLDLEIFPPQCPELARKPVDLFASGATPVPGGTGPEPATDDDADDEHLFDEEFDGDGNATVMDHAESEDGFGEGEDSTAMDSLFDEEFDGGDNATVMDHAETEDGFGEDKNGD